MPGRVACRRRSGARGGLPSFWESGAKLGDRPVTAAWLENSDCCPAMRAGNEGWIWIVSDGPTNNLMAVKVDDDPISFSGLYSLSGASPSDWESLASAVVGGQPYLYIGDTGDNANARATFTIYRVKEPVADGTGAVIAGSEFETIVCAFPGGDVPAHKDVETLLVDPLTGDMYVITKRITPASIYKLAHAASYTGTQTLEALGNVWTPALSQDASADASTQGYIVGGSIRPDGCMVALKNYYSIYTFVWDHDNHDSLKEALEEDLENPPQLLFDGYVGGTRPAGFSNNETKGEGICWDRHGRHLYTVSEHMAAYTLNNEHPIFEYRGLAKAPTTISFQDGASGYSGTRDTYVNSTAGSQGTASGTATTMIADYDASDANRVAFLKFDLSSVPEGAQVVGAHVQLYINTEGDDLFVHEMYQAWDENSTFTSLGGLPAFDGVDASVDPIQTCYGLSPQTGSFRLNIPKETVQGWLDGTIPNEGLLFHSGTNINGFQFRTREHATAADHPKLVIRYI